MEGQRALYCVKWVRFVNSGSWDLGRNYVCPHTAPCPARRHFGGRGGCHYELPAAGILSPLFGILYTPLLFYTHPTPRRVFLRAAMGWQRKTIRSCLLVAAVCGQGVADRWHGVQWTFRLAPVRWTIIAKPLHLLFPVLSSPGPRANSRPREPPFCSEVEGPETDRG